VLPVFVRQHGGSCSDACPPCVAAFPCMPALGRSSAGLQNSFEQYPSLSDVLVPLEPHFGRRCGGARPRSACERHTETDQGPSLGFRSCATRPFWPIELPISSLLHRKGSEAAIRGKVGRPCGVERPLPQFREHRLIHEIDRLQHGACRYTFLVKRYNTAGNRQGNAVLKSGSPRPDWSFRNACGDYFPSNHSCSSISARSSAL
jgi:hypothetical protein